MARRRPRWYFSFRSPYSWLAYRDLISRYQDVAELIDWLPFWEPDPRSEQMRVTERFRRTDFGHLEMEVTLTDPVMYTKPITLKIPHTIMADADIFESFCDNEKDRIHLENAKKGN